MNSNIRLGRLFGIPFYINPSWFFILALVTWTYGGGLAAQFPALSFGVPLLLGLVAALLLFASVLAHELGHSLVALRQGVGVHSITLFLFGGVASLEKESQTPADAFWVAIAGPLVSLALFVGLTLCSSVVALPGPVAAIISVLASVNLALALFNLIPGLPLDGGNILKALVWKITGNPYQGVAVASRAGQVIGALAIASGLLPLLLYGSFGNFWNLLLGGFLLQNAGQAAQFANVQQQFEGLTAADAISENSPVVAAHLSLREFADHQILNPHGWRKFLVVNEEGKLLGEATIDVLRQVAPDQWATTLVGELARPIDTTCLVESDQPLLDVARKLEEQRLSNLTVVRENDLLVGLLEKASILSILQRRHNPTAA